MSAVPTIVPQLLTPRMASMRTRMPWAVLRRELESAGCRVRRIAGRDRVLASDVAALIDAACQPTAAEVAARAEYVLGQVLEDLRLPPKRARVRKAVIS